MRDFQIYHSETFIHFLPLNPGGNSRSNGVFRKEVTCQGHVTGISVNRQLLNPNHKKKKKKYELSHCIHYPAAVQTILLETTAFDSLGP